MLSLRRRWRSSLLLFTALALIEGTAKAESLTFLDAEKDPTSFLQRLESLHTASDCSLTQLFWERVDIVPGQGLSLGIYRIDRFVPAINARVEANTLSILINHQAKNIWLRAGPWEDTGWIKADLQSNAVSTNLDPAFQSCSSPIFPTTKAFWTDPCQGREECESRYFLWSQSVEKNGKRDHTLIPARRVLERAPLGTKGVARWLLEIDYRGRSVETDSGQEAAKGLTASDRAWMSRIWRADRLAPISAQYFFPKIQKTSSEGFPAPARNGTVGAHEIFQADRPPSNLMAPRTGACTKIFAPRAKPKEREWGFTWAWEGLSEAKVPDLGGYTDRDGCLPKSPPTDFYVKLQSLHLAVQRVQSPEKKISLPFVLDDPYTFIEPGAQFFEVMVAANAFAAANQGLADFQNKVYSWLPERVKGLKIHQTPSLNSTLPECVAERVPGSLYLPLVCPAYDGFVAKGLCGDVVVHELAHEVLGSLVGLTTGGENQSLQNSNINEALSTFFALYFKPEDSRTYYAPLCQNDSLAVFNGNGTFDQRSLTSAFFFASNDVKETLPKLLILTAFYDWPATDDVSSADKFFDTFFDFAADKAELGEKTLKPICESLLKHAGRLPDKRCPDLSERSILEKPGDGTSANPRGDYRGKDRPAIFDKILPGFSITPAGSVQGWTLDGRQITAWHPPGQKTWEQRTSLARPSTGAPKIALSEWLGRPLYESPRIEILDIDTFEIELAIWPEHGVPQIRRYPFRQEIDPASLTLGLTEQGPVFEVAGRYPRVSRAYALRKGDLQEISDLAVFPLESPALSFRGAGKEVAVALDLLKRSDCGAPPYIRFVGEQLIVLTCDGVVASYAPDDEKVFRLDWLRELGSILSPSIGANPIQISNLDGSAEAPRLVLGPFTHRVKDKPEDRRVILSLQGEPLGETQSPN